MNPEYFFRLSLNAAFGLACLISLLTVALLLSKRLRQAWAAYSEKREAFYLPLILQAVTREAGAIPQSVFGAGRRIGDWRIVENSLFKWSKSMSGFGLEGLYLIFQQEGFADYEIRRLQSPRWWVRAQAARRLGQMLCVKAIPSLIRTLRDPSLEVRLVAVRALGHMGEIRAVEEIVRALATHSRLAALSLTNVIQELGVRAVPVLRELLQRPDLQVQVLAIRLLSHMKDKAAGSLIAPFLSSEHLEARIAACQALAEIGDIAAAPSIARVLRDPAWEAKAKAAWALGKLRSVENMPRLVACLEDQAWWVRFNAGEALASLGGEGKAALEGCLAHPDRFSRDMAAQWLDELSSGRVR
ncbi:MAG: hypothetical protein A2X37_09505 [Elusimicrobia bacterium GWA2_66_18]|nr:MAG: hypothetical protein A2X37_09505 [Elusimicrobia bacterium GWA2_66_18]